MNITLNRRIAGILVPMFCLLLGAKAAQALPSIFRLTQSSQQSRCAAGAKVWSYDPSMQPITLTEMRRIIRAPQTTTKIHGLVISRALYSHFLEYAVVEYKRQRDLYPDNPVFQSAFGACVVAVNDRAYKPSNQSLAKQQHDRHFVEQAADAVEDVVRSKGREVAYCWSILGYMKLNGFILDGRIIRANHNAGIAALERAIELDPKSAGAHALLARSLVDPQRSLEMANKAIELDPKRADPYYIKALMLFRLKRNSEANLALKRSFDLLPPSMRPVKPK